MPGQRELLQTAYFVESRRWGREEGVSPLTADILQAGCLPWGHPGIHILAVAMGSLMSACGGEPIAKKTSEALVPAGQPKL